MNKGLFDIHPRTQYAQEDTTSNPDALQREQRAEQLEQAAELKADILRQLQNGTPPESVLYTACKCIALLTAEPDYFTECEKHLDAVYGDLAQQSLETDKKTRTAAALLEQQREALQKMKKQADKNLMILKRLQDDYKQLNADITEFMPVVIE